MYNLATKRQTTYDPVKYFNACYFLYLTFVSIEDF